MAELAQNKWERASSRHPEKAYSVDKWHVNLCSLRQFLKRWGANLRADYKRAKSSLLLQIEKIDEKIRQYRHLIAAKSLYFGRGTGKDNGNRRAQLAKEGRGAG